MKIIIVGAGLGGLSAALRFAMLGHNVHVYEQQPSLSPRGGSLSTRPAASKILHAWGLTPDLERIANEAHAIIVRSLKTGVVVAKSAFSEDTEFPHWGTTREELVQLFYDKAVEAGASVNFGCAVSDVRDDAHQASITLDNGTTVISGDLVLAADGIHSRIRHGILADLDCPLDPIVSSITAYGFKLNALDVSKDPEAEAMMENSCSNVWTGGDDGVFVVSRYSPKGGYVAVLCHSMQATDQRSLWDERGDIGYVRAAVIGSGCVTPIARALQMAEACDRWRLAELPPLTRWTSQAGRIVLLGDSAHAMHPSSGQGFSQIVEDIEVLAQLVSRTTDLAGDDAGWLTRTWQEIRKPRVERIQDYSRWNTRKAVSKGVQNPPGQEPHTTQAVDFEDPQFVKWTLEYDVQEEINRYLARLGGEA